MVKTTKKLSKKRSSSKISKKRSSSKISKKRSSKKRSSYKLSKKQQKNLDKFNNFFTLLAKKEKVWRKKGEGYQLYKSSESTLREFIPNSEKDFVSLKRCSQEHCKNEFDIIMNKVLVERKKDSKKMLEEMFKSDREVEKENGLKKGDFMFELKDKKLVEKIKKGKQQAFTPSEI